MKSFFCKQIAVATFFACSLSATVLNGRDHFESVPLVERLVAGDGWLTVNHVRRWSGSGVMRQYAHAVPNSCQALGPAFNYCQVRGVSFWPLALPVGVKPVLIPAAWPPARRGVYAQACGSMCGNRPVDVSMETMKALLDSGDAFFCRPRYWRPMFLLAHAWPYNAWFGDPQFQAGVPGRSGCVDMVGMMPRLKKVFTAAGVPQQWAWMAEVESALNPRARSSAGAVGLFQLMPGTARRFGLNTFITDDRMEPEKSASAAAQYLKILHQEFGCWSLALAAYNAGEGRVREIMKKRKACTFNEVERYLPSETRAYVPKVIAVVAMREDQLHGVSGAYWMP